MKFKYKETEEVISVVRKAGEEVLSVYNKDFKEYEKSDNSPLTEADLSSERVILEDLRKYDYGILSEEKEDDLSRLREEKVWIIDPLDGTRDFIQKTGQFSIMVGLAEKGTPILGVVYQPTTDKLYFAEKDNGSYLIEKGFLERVSVSSISDFEKATFVFSRNHLHKREKDFIEKNNIENKTSMGSVGLKIGLIVEKKADCYFTSSDKTSQWDTCAPEIILREAGGILTDTEGEKFVYNREEQRNLKGILAGNKKIHSLVLTLIKND